jgi:glycosyltransferase involved in cell wall biosynthesis
VIHGRRSVQKKIWVSLFESKLWRNAEFIHAVSPLESGQLARIAGIPEIVHIPNGVRCVDANRTGNFENRTVWLFLGRLALEQKGLDILLDAYASFSRSCDDVPKLVLAGPDFRGGQQWLQRRAGELGIGDKIDFTGPLIGSAKERIWDRSELFLHPSRWEGMPLAILEAMGHGVPCLVSPETGLGDWIEKNDAGWVVESGVDNLSEAFGRIHGNRKALVTKGSNAWLGAKRDYSWDSIARSLLSKYHSNL